MRHRTFFLPLLVVAAPLGAQAASTASTASTVTARRPIRAEDVHLLKGVADPQLSPDGAR